MAKTLLDFVSNDATEKTELDGGELLWLGDGETVRATILTVIKAVKALAGGPVSEIPSLSSIVTAAAAAVLAEKGGPLRMNADGLVEVGTDVEYATVESLANYALRAYVDEAIGTALSGLDQFDQYLTWDDTESRYLPRQISGPVGRNVLAAKNAVELLSALPRWLQFQVYSDFASGGTSTSVLTGNIAVNNFLNGTTIASNGEAGHSGLLTIQCSNDTAHGGGRIGTYRYGAVLRTGTYGDMIFRLDSVADETFYIGLHSAGNNTGAPTAPSDSAMFSVAAGTATPTVRSASGTATTGTTLTVVAGTWYQLICEVLSGSSTRLLWKDLSDGSILRDATISASIPTAPVGFQVMASSSYSNATRRSLFTIDDMGFRP